MQRANTMKTHNINRKKRHPRKTTLYVPFPVFFGLFAYVGLSGLSQNIVFRRKCRNLSPDRPQEFAIISRDDPPFVHLKLIVGDGAIRGWIPRRCTSRKYSQLPVRIPKNNLDSRRKTVSGPLYVEALLAKARKSQIVV